MTVFLKDSSDCFTMTLFGNEFQSLNECLRVELPNACRLLSNMYGGTCIADRLETTLPSL